MNSNPVLDLFHPIIRDWFTSKIGVPSPPQEQGWPVIHRNENVFISAPTGAGKTLSAFLVCINWLLEQGLAGALKDQTYVLYISPLKALNNDIYRNLEVPLEGIEEEAARQGIKIPAITKAVRTGDTPGRERQKMLRKPPHILITTPESLYLLLTAEKSRNILKNIRYVIVDEIHALFNNKRGVHLTLSLERLRHLTGKDFVRIGLSATVKPMEEAARFLGGCMRQNGSWTYRPVTIIAPDMQKKVDLEVIVPVHDYRVLKEGSVWPSIYETIYKYILEHKSTLVFVNNRTTAEKIAANLNFMAFKQIAQTHHGSISRDARLKVEKQLKSGEIPCLVATSSLELGIDIGDIELIIQVASPKSAARGLQRLGRAGHKLNAVSKGRIIPRTRGDLLDSVVISREMMNKNIEESKVPKNALDIVSQHLVSMACGEEWKLDDIMELLRSAYPFNTIRTEEVIKVLNMLSGEYEHREDIPSSPRIYLDRVNQVMTGNNYSRMLAIGGCGTIPDRGYFGVYLEDRTTRLGELDEEFVFEARINDRFLLGTSAWRIVKIERDRVLVAPAGYSEAKTPFWRGEGLGRPYELGLRYGAFIRELGSRAGTREFCKWLMENAPVKEEAAENLEAYIIEQKEALGALSSEQRIIVECFGDETGNTRIVIHSHFGGRVNSGLSILLEHALTSTLHCEAESSYTDDGILIQLIGLNTHPRNIFSLIDSGHVEDVLVDVLPLTHVYAMTFRYNAGRALMMGTGTRGKRNPLWIQRLRGLEAQKLAQKYTDHPLVIETFRECLEYIMDVPSLVKVLRDIEAGRIEVVERFVNKPSPFSSELLFNFMGVAMYDPQTAKSKEPDQKIISGTDALNLNYKIEGQKLISESALEEMTANMNPLLGEKPVQSANELHSILLTYGDINTEDDAFQNMPEEYKNSLEGWFQALCSAGRAAAIRKDESSPLLWIAAEELPLYRTAFVLERSSVSGINALEAQKRIIRRFARFNSPFQAEDLSIRYGFDEDVTDTILNELEKEQLLIYGSFRQTGTDEWYHSTALEWLRHSSIKESRETVRTANIAELADFLCAYQYVEKDWAVPADGLLDVIVQLKGFYLPAEWWETIIFPARVPGYKPSWLDALCTSGKVFWRIRRIENKPRLAFFTMDDINFAETDDSATEMIADTAENSLNERQNKYYLY
ncbi:MAG TPA: DEAD/DEAH box helicase [Clostridiales bacterium]|nr:DEAD/DEAH box helicase [Clostridiales bacterium]